MSKRLPRIGTRLGGWPNSQRGERTTPDVARDKKSEIERIGERVVRRKRPSATNQETAATSVAKKTISLEEFRQNRLDYLSKISQQALDVRGECDIVRQSSGLNFWENFYRSQIRSQDPHPLEHSPLWILSRVIEKEEKIIEDKIARVEQMIATCGTSDDAKEEITELLDALQNRANHLSVLAERMNQIFIANEKKIAEEQARQKALEEQSAEHRIKELRSRIHKTAFTAESESWRALTRRGIAGRLDEFYEESARIRDLAQHVKKYIEQNATEGTF